VALSEAAVDRVKRPGLPGYYLSLSKALKSAEKWNTAYSPATLQVLAMAVSLELIQEEGLENVIRRHRTNARAVRAATGALGLKQFASRPCNATTVVLPPDGRAGDIIRIMELSHGLKVAGGQLHLAGKLCRLGHLGFYYESDMYDLVTALEGTLTELDINPDPGAGIAAVLESFQQAGEASRA
jgi:aspartate aminotransferase-like enzyme